VAAVCTREAHRGNGYATAVVQNALDYMARIGCDISLLHSGPVDYYTRLGYATVWQRHYMQVDPREAAALNPERLGTALAVRDLAPEDLPVALALYNETWGGRPGARVRDLDYLRWKASTVPYWRAAVDGAGRLRGYLAGWLYDQAVEAVAVDEEAAAALLLESVGALMAHETEKTARDRPFRWQVLPDAPVVRFARELCRFELMMDVRPRAGWMARIVDVQRTMHRLLPELEIRLKRSPYAGWMGYLRLETDAGQVSLAITKGRPALGRHVRSALVTRLGQADLAQLLFAYSTPAEINARQGLHFEPEVTGLLDALFPPRLCGLAGLDAF
jgi:predicted acetyltransferase